MAAGDEREPGEVLPDLIATVPPVSKVRSKYVPARARLSTLRLMTARRALTTVAVGLGLLTAIGCSRADKVETVAPATEKTATIFPERPFDYHAITLDNGMQVITLEDHSSPIAAVQVWYHVGSKDEKRDRRGFAHMFEHMMFRGTQNIGPKAHFEYIRKVGGTANAYTSFDNTTYIQVVPSNQVEMVMWLEAERMGFLKINDGYFDTERRVVAEEYRMGREAPYGTALTKILPQVFTKHPYAWSPIGDMDELGQADAKELQDFWNTYYVPNNAALVVVGDVDHKEIERQAKEYFGWIPKYPEPPRVTVKEPQQEEKKTIVIKERNGPVPILGIGFRTVPLGHEDSLALEALANVLGGGESSRLYRDLVDDQDLAMFAGAGAFTLEDDGIWGAGAALGPFGGKPKTTLKAIRGHIEKIRTDGVTEDELAKARSSMLRDAVAGQLTLESKAQRLGEAALILGDLDSVNRRFKDIAALTVDDLNRVAKQYLTEQREIEIRVEPNMFGFLVDQIKGGKEPKKDDAPTGPEEIEGEGSGKPGLTRPATLGAKPTVAPPMTELGALNIERHQLDNGLDVVVVPNDEVPFVNIVLGLEFGAFADPKDQPGVAYLAAPMVARGTSKHSYKELTDELDRHAISISGQMGMDSGSLSASAVSDQTDRAMRLLAEVAQTPTFPQAELTKYVSQATTGLAVAEQTPEYKADRELRRRMFPGHPYARLPEGSAAALRERKAPALAKWWKDYVRPDTTVLYVSGDITKQEGVELATKYFGDWNAQGARPSVEVPQVAPPAKTKIYLVDRQANQSQIRVGHVGINRHDPKYPTIKILSEVLGGGFNARLNDTIRVKKGLTYGARGGFYPDRFSGRFTISTFSKNATVPETVKTILEEIERIKTEAPSTKEQAEAISYVVGAFPRGRETPSDVIGQVWRTNVEGLGDDYYEKYLAAIGRVTSEDVVKAANEYIKSDSLAIVVVGPAKKLAPALRELAEVEVVKE